MSIHFLKKAASSIAAASPGKVRLFVDSADGLYKQRDENNNLKVLGNGIKTIAKIAGTGAPGTQDTYRITRDDNSTFDYSLSNGADGRSIESVVRTAGNGAPGTIDTYTITYNKSPTTSTFQVYNGADGATYTDEQAQDAVAALFAAATHDGVTITYDDAGAKLTVVNTDKGSSARAAHEAEADPHPQYTTTAEASAAAPVQSVTNGAGISVNASTGNITVTNADRGSVAVAGHEGAADPHPQYNTSAETATQINSALSAATAATAPPAIADAASVGTSAQFAREDHTHDGVTSVSVNGGAAQKGAVSIAIPQPKLQATLSALFASPANSTAVTVVLSLAIPANYLTTGKSFDFDLEGTQSQSAAATNVVGAIFVNGTQLVNAAVAGGTAAQTNRSIRMKGGIMWNGANYLGNITVGVSGVLPVGSANVAGVAVAAATAHNIDIRVQTSTANAANIIRAMVAAIKEI